MKLIRWNKLDEILWNWKMLNARDFAFETFCDKSLWSVFFDSATPETFHEHLQIKFRIAVWM